MNRTTISKRKSTISGLSATESFNERSLKHREIKEFKNIIKTKRPEPRDGHTTVLVADRFMLLFGGDRHHMPFNDVLILDLGRELED